MDSLHSPTGPLSDFDLDKFLKSFQIPIMEYADIPNYATIQDLMGEHNCVVIFNQNPKTAVGHWTLLLCYTDGDYEFFDSIFGEPDKVQQKWGLGTRYIKELKERSVAQIGYGETPLQGRSQTCGRWVLDRILKMKMRAKEYYDHYALLKTKYKRLDAFIIKSLAIPF